jgi:cephalosporin hydroxylase
MNKKVVDAFHCEYYVSEVWNQTFWRGHRVLKFPTDLIIYQEIIHEIRPRFIVECGTHEGGSAVFLGDMCELEGYGSVISIDVNAAARPAHSRVEYVTGDSRDGLLPARLNLHGRIMVILDSEHSREHVLKELAVWAPRVTPGSYLIIEDTNLGHPVRSNNPGPWEALDDWLPAHPEFEPDPYRERFGLTTNPRGYLRRRANP